MLKIEHAVNKTDEESAEEGVDAVNETEEENLVLHISSDGYNSCGLIRPLVCATVLVSGFMVA